MERESPARKLAPPAGLTAGRNRSVWVRDGQERALRAGGNDCLQEGPGLPPKWPYRLMPDSSGPMKVGEARMFFKSVFSMVQVALIGAFGLTGQAQQAPC